MKKIFILTLTMAVSLILSSTLSAQRPNVKEEVLSNLEKMAGVNYMYNFDVPALTKVPKGYEVCYISHYGRHGARYHWRSGIYTDLFNAFSVAHFTGNLTPKGEEVYQKLAPLHETLKVHCEELSKKGWNQHREIARRMYQDNLAFFKQHPTVHAVSSPVQRCILSMTAFCQGLTSCDPDIDLYADPGRVNLPGVVPTNESNPYRLSYPSRANPFDFDTNALRAAIDTKAILARLFKDVSVFPDTWGMVDMIRNVAINMHCTDVYMNIVDIFTIGELYDFWELGSCDFYLSAYRGMYKHVSLYEDILDKADAALASGKPAIDLRFGHDTVFFPLMVFFEADGFGHVPASYSETKDWIQDYRICMAATMQLVFCKNRNNPDDILVKLVWNGEEASLPLTAVCGPYYKWSDFKDYYRAKIANGPKPL